jgi:hypothetical protein
MIIGGGQMLQQQQQQINDLTTIAEEPRTATHSRNNSDQLQFTQQQQNLQREHQIRLRDALVSFILFVCV